MEPENPAIAHMRKLFNDFKAPYLAEQSGKEADQSLTIVDAISKNLGELYQVVSAVIKNKGVIPQTTNINTRAICAVFERGGVFPALRADPSLNGEMLRYAQLDLRTYPYSYSKHNDELKLNRILPTLEIIPNNL